MQTQIWFDIPEYEGLYEINKKCAIRNAKTGRILKPTIKIQEGGRLLINLRKNGQKETQGVSVWFARTFIPNPFNRKYVDHKNGDPSDNSESNLQWSTVSQNGCNRGKNQNNTSGFKGVTRNKGAGKWRAKININGTRKHLGYFNTAKEAAIAYDTAALLLHDKDFVRLNFPVPATPVPVTAPQTTIIKNSKIVINFILKK